MLKIDAREIGLIAKHDAAKVAFYQAVMRDVVTRYGGQHRSCNTTASVGKRLSPEERGPPPEAWEVWGACLGNRADKFTTATLSEGGHSRK